MGHSLTLDQIAAAEAVRGIVRHAITALMAGDAPIGSLAVTVETGLPRTQIVAVISHLRRRGEIEGPTDNFRLLNPWIGDRPATPNTAPRNPRNTPPAPTNKAVRKCLKCLKPHVSAWPGDRFHPDCKYDLNNNGHLAGIAA